MKIVKLIALFVCLNFSSSAQKVLLNIPVTGKTIMTFIPKGYDTIEVVKGDLNKDGVEDIVMALRHSMEDTSDMDKEPIRILLVLLKVNDAYRLVGKSGKALMCRHCGGMYGDPYQGIEIVRGILLIRHYGGSAWRWLNVQKFRYQQNGLYLIGSTSDYYWNVSDCDGNGVGDAGRKFRDVNFVTGVEEIIERTEECKLIKQIKQKIKREPLVKLEDFNFE